jgi:tetratricopeptide (TPR) repeat protein
MPEGEDPTHGAGELNALWAQLTQCDGEARADVLDQLGGVLVQQGRHSEALEVVEAARVLYGEAGCTVDLARVDHNAGVILAELNRMEAARERYHQAALGYAEALRWGEAATSWRALADLLATEGRIDEALPMLHAAVQLHTDAEEWVRAGLAQLDIGELLLERELVDEARPVLEEARRNLRRHGALLWVARADQLLADAARLSARWDEAFERLESARAVFDAADMDGDRDRCDDLWCSVLIDSGHSDEAVQRLEEARLVRQSEGDPVGVAWCDLHLSRALDRLGDREAAALHRRQARAVFDAAGLDALLRRRELQAT